MKVIIKVVLENGTEVGSLEFNPFNGRVLYTCGINACDSTGRLFQLEVVPGGVSADQFGKLASKPVQDAAKKGFLGES